MTKTIELMNEVKRKAGLTSNYQLSKKLELSESDICLCFKGKKHADEYAATRIALALEREPIAVIAEIKAESEKNPKKRIFWVNFLLRAATHCALAVALLLGMWEPSEAANVGAHSEGQGKAEIHNHKLCALAETLRQLARWLFGTSRPEAIPPA